MKKITLSIAAVSVMLLASCGQTNVKEASVTDTDTATLKKDNQATPLERAVTNWDKVDFTSPIVKYNEITSTDVEVRSTDMYSIYGLGENVLFTTGKADIRPEAKAGLDQVGASIMQHYPKGDIRVYGFTDAKGTDEANKQLSQQRADAVKDYLVTNCKLDAGRISTIAKGEEQPAATNADAKGRQQNRRVQVVAMKG